LGEGGLGGGEPLEGDGNITPREMTASAGCSLEHPTTEPGLQPPHLFFFFWDCLLPTPRESFALGFLHAPQGCHPQLYAGVEERGSAAVVVISALVRWVGGGLVAVASRQASGNG